MFQLGALVGPAVSGVLISTVGIGSAFVINAVSFLGSLVALGPGPHLEPGDRCPGVVRSPARSGAAVSYLFGRPEMRYPALLAGVFTFFTMSFPVTMAAFSHSVFHAGPSGFALLTSMLAAGSVVGSLLAARHGTFRLRGLVALAAALSRRPAGGRVGSEPDLAGRGADGSGGCLVLFGISANATVQLAAADHIRGRVMGLYLMVVLGSGCIGGPVVGAIDEHLGPRAGLLLGGLVPGLVTVVVGLVLARSVGHQDRPRDQGPHPARRQSAPPEARSARIDSAKIATLAPGFGYHH